MEIVQFRVTFINLWETSRYPIVVLLLSLICFSFATGAGKSVLCSAIVEDIDAMRKAFFYYDTSILGIRIGHVELAGMFLERGADVNTQEAVGSAPLHPASSRGHAEVVRMLLEHGADASAQIALG